MLTLLQIMIMPPDMHHLSDARVDSSANDNEAIRNGSEGGHCGIIR